MALLSELSATVPITLFLKSATKSTKAFSNNNNITAIWLTNHQQSNGIGKVRDFEFC